MAAGTFYAAHNASVRLASTVVHYANEWEVTDEARLPITTNFESAGRRTLVAGIKAAGAKITGPWDGGANPHEGTLLITAGANLTNVRLYTSGTSSPYWSFPSCYVERVMPSARAESDDPLMLTFEIKGTGTFTYPTGNIA